MTFNASIKRQKLSGQIKKHDLTICCLQETHFKYKDTYRLKVNGWRKIYHANTNEKRAGVAILMSDRTYFKVRKVIRDKEGYYIIIKESILQQDIIMYVPNNRASNYMRQNG